MIFPKNNHFKVTMYANSILGIWPFVFENDPIPRVIYDNYSKAVFIVYIIFIFLDFIQLIILLFTGTVLEIMRNMCVTVLRTVITLRLLAIRGVTIRKLIRKIMIEEQDILGGGDEEIMAIYNSYARQSQIMSGIFLVSISAVTTTYMINGFSVEDIVEFDSARNTTKIIKPMPISTWYPFDVQKYYGVTFWLQMWDGFVGSFLVMFVDTFNFSIIIFPLGQIRILSHMVSNFSKYVDRVKGQLKGSREEASFIALRECILRHKEIISYVEDYNNIMRNIMVLDFLQSSLQLASIIIQLFLTIPTILSVAVLAQYTVCMIIRLLIYYWYANEIMLESMNLSSAMYSSDWYDEPDRVKKMMILMMMRANKPLTLDIGPFSKMTLGVFLKVIKTTYSYMMIMYNV